MTNPKPKPSAEKAGEEPAFSLTNLFSNSGESSTFSITNLLGNFGKPSKEVNPYLDKAREAIAKELKKLKEEGKLSSTAASVYKSIRIAFIVDLKELNKTTEKEQKPYLEALDAAWKEHQKGRQNKEIMNSGELLKMNGFLDNVEGLDPLVDAINNYKPQDQSLESFLTNLSEKFPSLEPYVSLLGPLLTMFGLGSLKEKVATTSTKKGKKPDAKKPDTEKGSKEAGEVLKKKPGNTLLLGDSNNATFDGDLAGNEQNATKFKEAIDIDGEVKVLSKGSKQSIWVLNELEEKKDKYFTGLENSIVLTGSNDLGDDNVSADDIIKNLQNIYSILKKHGIKVYACTLPPIEGHKDWMEKNGEMKEEVVNKRNDVNKFIIESGIAHHVIRLDTEKGKDGSGGVADANGQIAEEYRRFKGPKGDYVHVDGGRLAEIYKRELEIGNKKETKNAANA